MPKFDSLGDRMKFYESTYGGNLEYLMPLVPAIVRLDGKAFHTFTKGLEKPFDKDLMELMIETTKFLVEETNAVIGYTQSDEITLILYSDDPESQIYFDGRTGKINSILSGKCANFFTTNLTKWLPSKAGQMPVFDCRCFSVPLQYEAVNAVLWREQDATRNSIQMVGQANFSHNQLMGKSCDEIQEMLWQEKKINWNDFAPKCKRGTYVQRRKVSRKFSTAEIDKLPAKHAARRDPDLLITRSEIVELEMPQLTRVVNKVEVFFNGAEPLTATEAAA